MLTSKRSKKLRAVASNRQSGLIIVLEDIHDPHNAAAVLRTCDAFGIQDVYFIFEQEEPFNPRRVGKATSSSANKWLTFTVSNSTRRTLQKLRKQGYEIIATVADTNAKDIFATKLTSKKIAILIGNEHRGLSPTAVKLADTLITIPMLGMVQSLNLSVTAAILMFEITRQRQKQKKQYLRSVSLANTLYKQFVKKQ
jgi:tRNA (guanosine-2'-O-)-methyltransferase